MTATGHAIIGTVIAAKIGNPALALPLAFASHIAADLIPHWDVGTNRRFKTKKAMRVQAAADVIISFILSYLLIFFIFPTTNLLYAFVVVIAAQAPDWLMTPYYFFGIRQFKWAYEFGKTTNKELDKPWGIIYQVLVLIAVVALGLLI